MRRRVVDELPEIRPHRRLTATDIDVEHLHLLQLVDDRLALLGAQFTRITTTRRGQAMHARQIAGVRQFPRQTDRCVETELELIDEFSYRSGSFESGSHVGRSCPERCRGSMVLSGA